MRRRFLFLLALIAMATAIRPWPLGVAFAQADAAQGKTLAALADTPEDAVLAALENEDADLCEIITVFVGKDAAASAELSARLEEAYPDCEITMHDGGQGVYEYLVAME